MRIAILTFHRAPNCGAMLQAWALRTVLERMGHVVEFPILNHVGEQKTWRASIPKGRSGLSWIRGLCGKIVQDIMGIGVGDVRKRRHDRFRRNYLPERACQPEDVEKLYDLVIVGSDQVWREELSRQYAPVFFAENLPPGVRKIAYAVSYGDAPLLPEELKRVLDCLPRFDRISVRERTVLDQIASYAKCPVVTTLDPTLLLSAVDYEAVAHGCYPRGSYLFMYTLDWSSFFVKTARELARRLGVKCVISPCGMNTRYHNPRGLTGICPDLLVQLSRHAKYIVAGHTFHGTVMGVLFNKPFLALDRDAPRHESRYGALLTNLGCPERLVNSTHTIDEMLQRLTAPLPDFSRIEKWRSESINWLRNAVNGKEAI